MALHLAEFRTHRDAAADCLCVNRWKTSRSADTQTGVDESLLMCTGVFVSEVPISQIQLNQSTFRITAGLDPVPHLNVTKNEKTIHAQGPFTKNTWSNSRKRLQHLKGRNSLASRPTFRVVKCHRWRLKDGHKRGFLKRRWGMRVFLTTSSVRGVLIRSVFTVFDAVTDQRLKQTLRSVLTHKLHVASTQRVCRWETGVHVQNDSKQNDLVQHYS